MASTEEQRSREVAESARQKEWAERGFLRQLFLGRYRYDWLEELPQPTTSAEAQAFHAALRAFLENEVDSAAIDAQGEYPPQVVDGLAQPRRLRDEDPQGVRRARASQRRVQPAHGARRQLLTATSSRCSPRTSRSACRSRSSCSAPRSRSRSTCRAAPRRDLGVRADRARRRLRPGEPVDHRRRRRRTATTSLNGEKLWCTNGTLAELLVVMARAPARRRKQISAFIVETDWPGVEVEHRCRFMGLKRARRTASSASRTCACPRENLIGEEGKGLKIALVTLNTGRLTLPAAASASPSAASRSCRNWANERVQWGAPIGKHEAIAHKIADMAAHDLRDGGGRRICASELSDRGGYDIRLEAAMAKEWNTDARLGDRRRHAADPRRPRLRDRAARSRRAARRRSASSA